MSQSMTSRERVLCALGGGEPDIVPFAEQFVGGTIPTQLLGLPAGAAYEPRQLADALHNDVVKFSHLPPLFCQREDKPDGAWGIGAGLIRGRDDLPKLVFNDDEKWIDDARRFLRTQRGDRAAAGGTRLGLSPTMLSMGLENFALTLYDDLEFVQEVMSRYAAFARRTVQIFSELGFDLVWCFDDFAYRSGPMFSPDLFRRVILPLLRPAAQAIQVPWIFHSDGDLSCVLDDLLTLGMSGIHPIEPESMDLAATKRALAGKACVVGNLSVDLLTRGTPEQVAGAVRQILATGAPGGGYMFSSGNCIPAYAAIENVHAMLDAFLAHRDQRRVGHPCVDTTP